MDETEQNTPLINEDRVYYAWIKIRNPWPDDRGSWGILLIWLVGFATFGVGFVVISLFDLFYNIPKRLHDDFSQPMGRDILGTPIPTNEIIRDLKQWGTDLLIMHGGVVVGIALLVMCILFAFADPWAMLLIPFVFLLTRTLKATSIFAAALPAWLTSTGLFLLVFVLPFVFGVTGLLLLIGFLSFINQGHSTHWLLILPSLYLVLLIISLEKFNPVLLQKRRVGVWV